MSARCWNRRRQGKHFEQDLKFVTRQPEAVRTRPEHGWAILGVDAAKALGILVEEPQIDSKAKPS